MAPLNGPSAERLRELFHYDRETGLFTRKVALCNSVKVGEVCSRRHFSGYINFSVDKRQYMAHRLAWLYVYGEWPDQLIDHINGDKVDNRIANLRLVTGSQNLQNQRRARVDNRLGLLGVSQCKRQFVARITVDKKTKTIGRYGTPEEAHAAYLAAKRQLHSTCTI